jgi:hypothetical protein
MSEHACTGEEPEDDFEWLRDYKDVPRLRTRRECDRALIAVEARISNMQAQLDARGRERPEWYIAARTALSYAKTLRRTVRNRLDMFPLTLEEQEAIYAGKAARRQAVKNANAAASLARLEALKNQTPEQVAQREHDAAEKNRRKEEAALLHTSQTRYFLWVLKRRYPAVYDSILSDVQARLTCFDDFVVVHAHQKLEHYRDPTYRTERLEPFSLEDLIDGKK